MIQLTKHYCAFTHSLNMHMHSSMDKIQYDPGFNATINIQSNQKTRQQQEEVNL